MVAALERIPLFEPKVYSALFKCVDVLERLSIPYVVSGGFAARIYGAIRPLMDIDIDVPPTQIAHIVQELAAPVKFSPGHYRDDEWDLEIATLDINGQEVDICDGEEACCFNRFTKKWEKQESCLNESQIVEINGRQIRIMPAERLLAYKQKLGRPVDVLDVAALEHFLADKSA